MGARGLQRDAGCGPIWKTFGVGVRPRRRTFVSGAVRGVDMSGSNSPCHLVFSKQALLKIAPPWKAPRRASDSVEAAAAERGKGRLMRKGPFTQE